MNNEDQLKEIERILLKYEIFRCPIGKNPDGTYIEQTVLDVFKEFVYDYETASLLCGEYEKYIENHLEDVNFDRINNILNKMKTAVFEKMEQQYKERNSEDEK